MNFYGWNVTYSDYVTFCKECNTNDNLFDTFRRNKIYNGILEGGSEELGKDYIKFIEN